MPSLDTTNLMLGVIAAAALGQLLLVVLAAVWLARQIAQLRAALSRFESAHLPGLIGKIDGLTDDFHRVAERVDRVGREVERTTHAAQGILNLAGSEVERATRGVHAALDIVENGVRRASRVGSGVRAGVRRLFSRRTRIGLQDQAIDADAIARFEAGA